MTRDLHALALVMIRNTGLRGRELHRWTKFDPNSPYGPLTAFQARWESTAVRKRNERVNPPLSTLPPPLEVPVRGKEESFFPYAFKSGKAYLGFYKSGLKAVLTNYNTSKEILKQASISGSSFTHLAEAARANKLSRSEFHSVRRARRDITKLPLFGLVMLVCGEFTPLVVVFMSRVVPGTCRVPRQVENDRQKVENRREVSFDALGPASDVKGLDDLTTPQLLHAGRSLDLVSRRWPDAFLSAFPLRGLLLKPRLVDRLKYLDLDDALIRRDGGVAQLEKEESVIALSERGLNTVGKTESALRESLKAWLQARKENEKSHYESILELILRRPKEWP